MRARNLSSVWVALAMLLAMVIVLLSTYVAAYFMRGTYASDPFGGGYGRTYHNQWEADLFRPAAKLESVVTGQPVSIRGIWRDATD